MRMVVVILVERWQQQRCLKRLLLLLFCLLRLLFLRGLLQPPIRWGHALGRRRRDGGLSKRGLKPAPLDGAGSLAGVHVVDAVRPEPLTPVLEPDLHSPGGHVKLGGELASHGGAGHRIFVEGAPQDGHLVDVGPGATSRVTARHLRAGGA